MRRFADAGIRVVTNGDSVFRDLAFARIIELTSKIDAARVLSEVGVESALYGTGKRRRMLLPPSRVIHRPFLPSFGATGP